MEIGTELNAFTVKTPVFEGPFALLLSLVEEKKLFINDLSLALVTEDYLKYVNSLKDTSVNLNSEQVASFIVVAATLILIKSKSLLPNLTLTNEEEDDIKNLEDRLKLYEMYTKLGVHVKESFGKNIIFAPLEKKQTNVVFLPDEQISKESMMMLVQDVLGRMPKKTTLPEVAVKKVISIEEMIDKLTLRIENSLKFNFKDFVGVSSHSGVAPTKEERVLVIVGFLAMLELARTGILDLVQENNFEDIQIEKRAIQEPHDEELSVAEEEPIETI